jgi:hypothetical protein
MPTCRTALWPQQTLMVQAGAGACNATTSDRVTGMLCCKTKNHTAARPPGTEGAGVTSPELQEYTAPTHISAYVWLYSWPVNETAL